MSTATEETRGSPTGSPQAGGPGGRPPPGGTPARARRDDLAAFLRSRRARLAPEDVGLPPGTRRRTQGLRREEVAQLSGVGVTWYTWLEQGRPINASVSVLDAIGAALRLDQAEREHLYRLADVPAVPAPDGCQCLAPEVQTILDSLPPLPAAVINDRFDLLAWNSVYATLFPLLVGAPKERRNTLWQSLKVPSCCNPLGNRDRELRRMVALLRGAYGRHVGEPAWTDFVRRLTAHSPEFARMWATHDVADPGTHVKVFRHAAVGNIELSSTGLAVLTVPDTRMYVYTPTDDAGRRALERLVRGEGAGARFPCDHLATRPGETAGPGSAVIPG